MLLSYIGKLLPSVINYHSHFQGVITGVEKNLCFEFLSIFHYKRLDKFLYRNIRKIDIQDKQKYVHQSNNEECFCWICVLPRDTFNSLAFCTRQIQIPIPALHCSSLISHSTNFNLFQLLQIVRQTLFPEVIFRWGVISVLSSEK